MIKTWFLHHLIKDVHQRAQSKGIRAPVTVCSDFMIIEIIESRIMKLKQPRSVAVCCGVPMLALSVQILSNGDTRLG